MIKSNTLRHIEQTSRNDAIETWLNNNSVTKGKTPRYNGNMTFPLSKGRGSIWNASRAKAITKQALDTKATYK
jgi:hypothetical protein